MKIINLQQIASLSISKKKNMYTLQYKLNVD